MSTWSECSSPSETEDYLRDIRADLLSGNDEQRRDGLRRLYVDLAEREDLWFDRLGHVAGVGDREGFEAGLVELVFCLAYPEEWQGTAAHQPAQAA